MLAGFVSRALWESDILKIWIFAAELLRYHLFHCLICLCDEIGAVLLRAMAGHSRFGGRYHVARLVGDLDEEVMDFL